MKNNVPYLFAMFALAALIIGVFFGCLAALQYLFPDLFKSFLAFNKMRPFHVTSVVSWIVLAPTAVVYSYLKDLDNAKIGQTRRSFWHFIIFLLTGLLILFFLATGLFGGREYMVFSPVLSIPVFLGWCLLASTYFPTVFRNVKRWPVFLWMWASGIGFFLFTFLEAHLWLIPFFRDNMVRELTVQWKSYGALVGSWNMMVYGTAIYVMYKIKNDDKLIFGKLPFFLYFIGAFNLMFGWAHHTYIVPAEPWIRHIAYAVSMSELIILGIIIRNWKKSAGVSTNSPFAFSENFLGLSDFWILLNLILALLISVPFINYYTHGTHITVAHAMGTTIGINSTILLAAMFYLISSKKKDIVLYYAEEIKIGYKLFSLSLLVFWLSLIAVGIVRSQWYYGEDTGLFRDMINAGKVHFFMFILSGITMTVGLILLVRPLLIGAIGVIWKSDKTKISSTTE